MNLREAHIDFYKKPKRRPSGIGLPSGRERADADYYVEPRWLVEALLDVEPIVGNVLDPFAGGGSIVGVCLSRGLRAEGSDLYNRGFGRHPVDAFSITDMQDNIVTNPPFIESERAVEHYLPLVRGCLCLLGRLNFLEAQCRHRLFDESPPSRVWVTSRRASIPPGNLAHPRDQFGAINPLPGKGGSTAFAWFVWDKAYTGKTILDWLPLKIDPSRPLRRRAKPQQSATPTATSLTLLPPEPVTASTPARGAAIAKQLLQIAKSGRIDTRDSAGARWSGTTIVLLREVDIFEHLPVSTDSIDASTKFTPERLERVLTPPANGRLKPVSIWQRVVPAPPEGMSVSAERPTQIVGTLPNGTPITLAISAHAALAWAAGPDGDLVVDAKSHRVFARNATGQVVGVGMAMGQSEKQVDR
jgi:hypothetical protein